MATKQETLEVARAGADAFEKVLKMEGKRDDKVARIEAEYAEAIRAFVDSLSPEVRAAFEALGGRAGE